MAYLVSARDKEAGDQFARFFPGVFDLARMSRYFIGRVVRYLAGEAGIRQFLDIAAPYRVRRADQIARFFDGLELVDPGVVPIQQWRPDRTPFDPPRDLVNLGGVGRKT
jgi:hypothetical protein